GAGCRLLRLLRVLARLLELGAQRLELARAALEHRVRLAGRHRLDAARAGADGALVQDHERPDLCRRADVRAPAQLGGVPVDLDDAYLVAVLLAEEHHRPELARLLDGGDER